MHLRDAGVAHPVERHLAKVEVASSSLVTRSIKRLALQVVFFMNNDLEDPYAYPFQHPGPGCDRGHHARAAHRQPVPEEVCVSNAPFPQGKGVFSLWRQDAQAATNCLHADGACHTGFNGSSYLVIARRRPQGRRRGNLKAVSSCRHFPEIATSASPPRNDIRFHQCLRKGKSGALLLGKNSPLF